MSGQETAELERACFEHARNSRWVHKPIDLDETTVLADRLTKIARGFVYPPLRIDTPLVVRAIRYLNRVYGRPMADETQRFSIMLCVVLEIARPNHGLDEAAKAFLKDMLDGIEQSAGLN